MGDAQVRTDIDAGKKPGLESETARLASAAIVFVISLALYGWTLAPTVTLVDSGELILAAYGPGVAHPPGFPLYVLLAHLATLVPAGRVAARVNFASALFGALAAAALTLLVYEMLFSSRALATERLKAEKESARKKKTKESATKSITRLSLYLGHRTDLIGGLLPGIVAGLLFAFSRTLWAYSTIAEVYTLNTFLIVVIFLLMFRWRRFAIKGAPPRKVVYAAALVFGLSLGVHHVTVGLMLPALAWLVYSVEGIAFFKSKKLPVAALFALAGLAIYLYLPISASRGPLMNWGDPRTFERLWWHVTGRQYQVFFSFSLERVFAQSSEFFTLIGREYGRWWAPFGLLLVVSGFVSIFRYDRRAFWFLLLFVAADLVYALNYEIAEDKDAYYLPAFVAMAAAAGYGAHLLVRALGASRLPAKQAAVVAITFLLITPTVSLATNLAYDDRSRYYIAEDYVNNILITVEPNSMLLTLDWQVYSPMLYVLHVEKRRSDVVAIDVNQLRRSWYFDYLNQTYPDLINQTRDKVDPYLEDLRHWEQEPTAYERDAKLNQRITTRFYDMILALVTAHIVAAPVYITSDIASGRDGQDAQLTRSLSSAYQFVPQGLVFQLTTDREFREPAAPDLQMRGLNDGSIKLESNDVVKLKVLPVYTVMMTNRGLYLAAHGRHEQAVESFKRALEIDPTFSPARQGLNESLKKLRSPSASIR
jgi:tetratricopeptide (TPR) repeat protein